MQRERTPLHHAASRGDTSTAKLLLEAGADVMARDNVSSCAAIARDLSDVCYRHYGEHRIWSANFFCYMPASITEVNHDDVLNIGSTIVNAHQRKSMGFSEAIIFSG